MAVGAREEAIPLQQLVELILDRAVACEIGEDNTSTITAINKRYSPALRHLLRQQRCSLGHVHDLVTDPPPAGVGEVTLVHRRTDTHKGDSL